MSGKGVKRKQQPKSPMRKRRSLDGPMDRMLKKITNGSEGGLLHYNHGNRANLCGQVDIESICQIIREWVSTEEDLMDEDIAYINKFFLDLVDEQDFERLQIALDVYFDATTEREVNGEDWRNVYNDVANLISFECVQITARKFEK